MPAWEPPVVMTLTQFPIHKINEELKEETCTAPLTVFDLPSTKTEHHRCNKSQRCSCDNLSL